MPNLANVRVALLATDGVEEVELMEPLKALRDGGAHVDVIAPHGGTIQAMQHKEKGSVLTVDRTLGDVEPGEYDALLLPGGTMNADALRVDPEAQVFAQAMQEAGKPIAAICHAPWLLISAELVSGRRLTSYHTIQDDICNAGGIWEDEAVVMDDNWLTSRQPKDLPAFTAAVCNLFSGKHVAEPAVGRHQ